MRSWRSVCGGVSFTGGSIPRQNLPDSISGEANPISGAGNSPTCMIDRSGDTPLPLAERGVGTLILGPCSYCVPPVVLGDVYSSLNPCGERQEVLCCVSPSPLLLWTLLHTKVQNRPLSLGPSRSCLETVSSQPT